MTGVVPVSLLLAAVSLLLPQSFLSQNCYLLFGIQGVWTLTATARRLGRISNMFLPSTFTLIYFTVNLTIGGYLVPRGYGFDKQFSLTTPYVTTYNIIVPFLLLTNLVLYLLSARRLPQLNSLPAGRDLPSMSADGFEIPRAALYFGAFLAVGYFDFFNGFSTQLAIMICHLTGMALRRTPYRFPIYLAYLVGLIYFSAENKREIAMALFLVAFIEMWIRDLRTRFTPRAIVIYLGLFLGFIGLIMWASILRGYGEYNADGPIDALSYIPTYAASDDFADGITDNLELNYNYGVTITSIDYVLTGQIPYQFGTSFLKILYLPVPRQVFPTKPESVLQIFTKSYAPGWWSVGGSMPVMFAAECFINFHVLGLLALAAVMAWLDGLFVAWHRIDKRSLAANCSLFLCITILLLARGAGIDQFALYFLVSVPTFLLISLVRSTTSRRGQQMKAAA